MANEKTIKHDIVVMLPHQRSYMRAGFKFLPGKNHLRAEEVSEEQLKKLKADPHLKVQMPEANQASEKKTDLDAGNLAKSVELDIELADVAEHLHPLIAILLDERPEKKPTVDDMKFEFDNDAGESQEVKPSAADRDAAWAIYQDELNKAIAEQQAEQGA